MHHPVSPEMVHRHIDERATGDVDVSRPTGEEELSPELQALLSDVQGFIDGRRSFLNTFAGDTSLQFRASDRFMINLENGEVHMDIRWFVDQGYSKEQILWAVFHELSHFRDLADDPARMRENFVYIEDRARQTAPAILKKFEAAFGTTHPDIVAAVKEQRPLSPKDKTKTMNAAELAAMRIHHRFFNIFDDAFVNSMVARRAPAYESGTEGGKAVEALYRKLFPIADYTKDAEGGMLAQATPRHLQFLDKLLRDVMVTDETTMVSDDVGEALHRKLRFEGRLMTARQLVDNYLRPKTGRDTLAGRRYEVLRQTLEPVFEELLRKDIAEWQPRLPAEWEGSVPMPWKEEYDAYDQKNPDKFSDESVSDWIDDREKKQKASASGSPEEQPKPEEMTERDEAFCREHNIDEETFKTYVEIRNSVAPYLNELARLWRSIVYGSSVRVKTEMVGHFRSGEELDVGEAIRQYPSIARGDTEDLRLMKRRREIRGEVNKPERINLRFVGDGSGSILDDDGTKLRVLRQCYTLLMESFGEFNTYLGANRAISRTKLRADTEAWMFSKNARKIKSFAADTKVADEAEIIRNFAQVEADPEGSTRDFLALQQILASLSPHDLKQMADGKNMELVIVVTDGGSSNSVQARAAVDELTNKGVVARAFQIGEVNEYEQEVFNSVWNYGHDERFGELVGGDVANVVPAIVKLLKKYLGDIKI